MLRNMRVLVDIFHSKGHTCPDVCFCSAYPALRGVNTSGAENLNSLVWPFKRSIRSMGVQRAMLLLRVIMAHVAQRAIERIEEKASTKAAAAEAYARLKANLGSPPDASS